MLPAARRICTLAMLAALTEATCPLPLPENRLKIRILAGEKAYRPARRSAQRAGGKHP